MLETGYLFSAREILNQVHRELVASGADLKNISITAWKEYILARAIEDVLVVVMSPALNPCMESTSNLVRSNYRREDDGQTHTLEHDVGSNKIFPKLGSYDLSFESNLQLYGNCVVISPGKKTLQI